jgi:hypothetical protein
LETLAEAAGRLSEYLREQPLPFYKKMAPACGRSARRFSYTRETKKSQDSANDGVR